MIVSRLRIGTATCARSSSNSFCASVSIRTSSLSRRRIRPSRASCPPMPESSESSKCSSRPDESPMAVAERSDFVSSGEKLSAIGEHGRFRKIAARFTLKISRRNCRNCFSIASASSECVRMDEKSRSTSSVCAALTKRPGAEFSDGRNGEICDDGIAGDCDGRVAICVDVPPSGRSNSDASSRVRTGFVKMCVRPCRNASSSQADSL